MEDDCGWFPGEVDGTGEVGMNPSTKERVSCGVV